MKVTRDNWRMSQQRWLDKLVGVRVRLGVTEAMNDRTAAGGRGKGEATGGYW